VNLPKLFRLPQPDPTRLPLGIVTGTGVLKGWMGEVAYAAYTRTNRNKVFPIFAQGLGKLDEAYAALELEILAWVASLPLGTKVALMGHSQGAIHVERFGLEHPECVAEVICLCGPLDGTKLVGLTPPPMRPLLNRVAPGIADMGWQSEYLTALRAKVQTSWPKEVRIRLIAVSGDLFVRPRRSALDLQFPEGTDVKRYYLGLFRPPGLSKPDAENPDPRKDVHFVQVFGADHVTVLFHPATLRLVGHARSPQRHLHMVEAA
jgi:pimeloyl-ACP methyl ester carboxylesterase